jgi:hypothetical protein
VRWGEGVFVRLSALVNLQIHPQFEYFCLIINILQFSSSFSAPVNLYILHSILTNHCGTHTSNFL